MPKLSTMIETARWLCCRPSRRITKSSKTYSISRWSVILFQRAVTTIIISSSQEILAAIQKANWSILTFIDINVRRRKRESIYRSKCSSYQGWRMKFGKVQTIPRRPPQKYHESLYLLYKIGNDVRLKGGIQEEAHSPVVLKPAAQ